MKKISFVLIATATLLTARTNPFFMPSGVQELGITSNSIKTYPPLKSASITLPSSARILKQVSVKFINIDGSVGTKTIHLSNKIDWRVPIFISQAFVTSAKESSVKQINKPADTVQFHKFLTLKIFSQSVDFATKDKNLRFFMMISPYRAVLDFKRESSFLSFYKRLNNTIFKSVAIGNHNGYYRVVLELDGDYGCQVSKTKQGYALSCF